MEGFVAGLPILGGTAGGLGSPPLSPLTRSVLSEPSSPTSPSSPVFTPISPQTLTSIPPELLLKILTHLPPAHLSPLIHTSRGLSAFLTSHAALIHNTHLQTHHAHALALLVPRLKNGWLVPTHPLIINEETALLATKNRRRIGMAGFCGLGGQAGDDSDVEGEGEEIERREKSWLLSSPGPQFAWFMEENAWKIEYHHERARSLRSEARAELEHVGIHLEEDEADDQNGGGDRGTKDDGEMKAFVESRFANDVALHVVRPALRTLDGAMSLLREYEMHMDEQRGKTGKKNGLGMKKMNALCAGVMGRVKRGGGKVFGRCLGMRKEKVIPIRKPLFGEVVRIEKEIERHSSPEEQAVVALRWWFGEWGRKKLNCSDDRARVGNDEGPMQAQKMAPEKRLCRLKKDVSENSCFKASSALEDTSSYSANDYLCSIAASLMMKHKECKASRLDKERDVEEAGPEVTGHDEPHPRLSGVQKYTSLIQHHPRGYTRPLRAHYLVKDNGVDGITDVNMPSDQWLVNGEPRRRTKKACLTCQKKKLKCNGMQPCSTCLSRSIQCTYAETAHHTARSQAKQQNRQQQRRQLQSSPERSSIDINLSPQLQLPAIGILTPTPISSHASASDLADWENPSRCVDATGFPGISIENVSGRNSERDRERGNLKEQSRLLQDGKGRLLYLGDSASLSYLDTIRRLVESTLGPSEFTSDVHKSKILEGSISTGIRPTHILPDREAAEFLLESFFSNTIGALYIFDRKAFGDEVAAIYDNPLQIEQSRLSILNLVFAVGLQLTRSSAAHGFREAQILKRLDGGSFDRAEMFYLNATHLNDPISGFEDGDITSIQALLLISVFMLTVAKRNASWAYFGMAVRSAYALGLHKKQTSFAFTVPEQQVRRNVWRSLYVMDCFLSAMLGRPNSIDSRIATESFASDSDLEAISGLAEESLELSALNASVQASRLTGDILSNVYADRKISVKLAQKISNKFQAWKTILPSILHWQNINMPDEDPRVTLAQVHVNLNYFHGIILLTRPFLLQKIVDRIRDSKCSGNNPIPFERAGIRENDWAKAEPFPGVCVKAAVYTIDAIQVALLKRALPRRDPFVIYWLFTASLIVFTNGFCTVYHDIDNKHTMETALNLHRYFGKIDPLAGRFLTIIQNLKEAISQNTVSHGTPNTSKCNEKDVFSAFFGGVESAAEIERAEITACGSSNVGEIMNTGVNHRETSSNQTEGLCFEPRVVERMEQQQFSLESDQTSISPPGYSLDFDAFLTNVGQDSEYQQDLWMPLYGTMDMNN